MSSEQSTLETARTYYNSDDADNFYFTIWGGEDIHVGLYQSADESIFDASRRTVERMASFLPKIDSSTKIIDIGAGYGGAARYLANIYGCSVVALNLSEVENDRDRAMNKKAGLDHLIEVVDGSFEEIPYPDEHFDIVWSQDALLHSYARAQVFAEVKRILVPGGYFVFTDPMRKDDCPLDVLQPILDRIHLDDLGSPGFYRDVAEKLGMSLVTEEDHAEQLPRHYGRVLEETQTREEELKKSVSYDYISRMKKGLNHWVNGGKNGYLTWKIFVFKK